MSIGRTVQETDTGALSHGNRSLEFCIENHKLGAA
jgi:hypothetical protein